MRLIDADKLIDKAYDVSPAYGMTVIGVTEEDIEDAPTVEAIPKADYETRLKADMAAMLTDLSMEIGEIEDGYTEFDEENKRSLSMMPLESVDRLIQQKIDKLKADQEET